MPYILGEDPGGIVHSENAQRKKRNFWTKYERYVCCDSQMCMCRCWIVEELREFFFGWPTAQMCHLLPASAFLRCSVIRFRRHDVHVRNWKFQCRVLPLLSHHIASSRADSLCRNSSSKIPGLTRENVSCKFVHVGSFLPDVVYLGFKSFRSSKGRRKYGAACAFEGFGGGDALSSDAEDDEEEEEEAAAAQECIVVNFYHLVEVDAPQQEVARHTAFMKVSFTIGTMPRPTTHNGEAVLQQYWRSLVLQCLRPLPLPFKSSGFWSNHLVALCSPMTMFGNAGDVDDAKTNL